MEKSNNFKQLSQGRGIKRKFDEAFGSFGIRKEFEGIENGKRTRNTDSGFDSEMVTVDTDTEAEDMAEEQMEMVTMDTDTEAEDTAEEQNGDGYSGGGGAIAHCSGGSGGSGYVLNIHIKIERL